MNCHEPVKSLRTILFANQSIREYSTARLSSSFFLLSCLFLLSTFSSLSLNDDANEHGEAFSQPACTEIVETSRLNQLLGEYCGGLEGTCDWYRRLLRKSRARRARLALAILAR
jgi:hypothetical protein